jgi:hypothetical protein
VLTAQQYTSTGAFVLSLLHTSLLLALYNLFLVCETVLYRLSPFHPLASFPGPIINKLTSLRLATAAASGKRHVYVAELHKQYGVIVRVGMYSLLPVQDVRS